MESSGKVTSINGKKIKVMMFKESSCAHCSGCGEASKLTREIELEYNPHKQKIEIGDIVTFELADSKMLKIGFLGICSSDNNDDGRIYYIKYDGK